MLNVHYRAIQKLRGGACNAHVTIARVSERETSLVFAEAIDADASEGWWKLNALIEQSIGCRHGHLLVAGECALCRTRRGYHVDGRRHHSLIGLFGGKKGGAA